MIVHFKLKTMKAIKRINNLIIFKTIYNTYIVSRITPKINLEEFVQLDKAIEWATHTIDFVLPNRKWNLIERNLKLKKS